MDTKKYANPYRAKLRKEGQVKYTPEEATEWIGGNIDVATGTMACLEEQGLTPRSSLLDFGCGCFRIGGEIIKKIGAENYYAMDIDPGLMEVGLGMLTRQLISTNFMRVVSGDFEFNKFKRPSFDFILAQGVVTHMPDPEIQRLFKKIEEYLSHKGKALVTYVPGVNQPASISRGTFKHSYEHLREMVKFMNLAAIEVPYKHPRGLKMLCLLKFNRQ